MRPTSSLALLLLTACNPDAGLTKFNSEPEAQITAPSDGSAVLEGTTVTLRGAASDPNHATSELLARWFVGEDEACASTAPAADGTTTCETRVPDGEAMTVRLEVLDPAGAAGTAEATYVITPNAAPTASIASPLADGVHYSDQLITFRGTVADAEDAPETLTAWWEDGATRLEQVESRPNGSGEVLGYALLAEGPHALELHVQDTAGNETVATVLVDVGPPNSAPLCAVVAPATDGASSEGARVDFVATASDVDVPANRLSVIWESDKDGTLGTSTPDSAGNIAFSTASLSVDTHRVTMTVADELGASCARALTWTVGTPPEITLESPLPGEVVNDGAPVTFSALVSDREDVAGDLRVRWESDRDGLLREGAPDSGGLAQFLDAGLSVGDHVLTVTVTDSAGLYATALGTLTVNGIPSAPGVSLAPAAPSTSDDLVARIDAPSIDPDGDPVTYSFAWLRDGAPSSASTSATLPASATRDGETWRVDVVATDGLSSSAVGSASVTIQNTAPTLATVALTPDPARPNDTLTCTPSGASDADGDVVSYTYRWTVDGVASGSGATLTGPFAVGALIACTVTPTDGKDTGAAVTDTATIANTLPVVSSVTLTPSTVRTNDTLSASVVSADADGDAVSLRYRWFIDGVEVTGATGSSLSGALTGSFDRDEVVTVEVTPNDGAEDGLAVVSAGVTVQNTTPTTPGIAIAPTSPAAGDDLVCSVVTPSVDADGDTVTYTFGWDVDGAAYSSASTAATNSTVDSADVGGDETWTCEVTAGDGTGTSGTVVASVTRARLGSSATAAAFSCLEILNAGDSVGDGTYWVNPDGTSAYQVYCDMTTDGGGWTLMAKFSQHRSISNLSTSMYDSYFRTNLWIDGFAERVPTSPVPSYDAIHVESVDWSDFLMTGQRYELRQRFFKATGTQAFDVGYTFTYNGYTDQNSTSGTNRAWELSTREVFADTTGITWNTPTETVRFWLPFKEGVTGSFYTGCYGYEYGTTHSCGSITGLRRYGNAGIMGATMDSRDPAAAWAPDLSTEASTVDMVYVYQATGVYGYTSAQMALLYYIR